MTSLRSAMDRPSIAEVKSILSYDAETGLLVWRSRQSGMTLFGEPILPGRPIGIFNRRWAGKQAGTLDAHGYLRVGIGRRYFRAHQLAWVLHYGKWPDGSIDHINGSKADNRVTNLRIVSQTANARNASRRRDNRSGTTGVSWNGRKWCVQIPQTGKRGRHLGYFSNLEDAVAARKTAETESGFHPNHGRARR